jgi:hypothetical protein
VLKRQVLNLILQVREKRGQTGRGKRIKTLLAASSASRSREQRAWAVVANVIDVAAGLDADVFLLKGTHPIDSGLRHRSRKSTK